jgi:DNA polymerase I-like protein with 3'-5' exonuclease and polymerase domains
VENPDSEEYAGDETLFEDNYVNPDDSTGLWQYRQLDDKIHGIYKTMMTHSHRHSSTEPNLQNLSRRNWETAQAVRKCYQAPLELETTKENADFLKI